MIYSVDNNLIEKINFLRENLEDLLKETCGIVTEETVLVSERLDKLLVAYYKQNIIL